MRPLRQGLQCRGFNGNGRTDRVSLQIEVTAFDEWNCRADVACVGADTQVRPYGGSFHPAERFTRREVD